MSQQALTTAPVLVASNGGLFKSKWRMHPGRYELTADRIIWYQRSAIWMYFGLIGALIGAATSGKRALDLELAKIASIARGKHGFNKKILDVTMTDGVTHRICVDKFDAFHDKLRELLVQRGAVSNTSR